MTSPQDIAPETVQPQLTSRVIGRVLRVVDEVGSTNDEAMAAGHAGEREGLAIIADRQGSGRGRLGRVWASPAGLGLYTSILVRPDVPPPQAPFLTIVAALATADAIRSASRLEPKLKWPNDVLVDGLKIAGVLAEMATVGQRVDHAVIGIGINVHHTLADFPADVRTTATSIDLASGQWTARGAVAAALYNALDRRYAVFMAGDTRALLAEARARTITLGRSVTVVAGSERWQATALDLDADGALLVRDTDGRIRRVLAGDVSIR